jgi:hypothetical protein
VRSKGPGKTLLVMGALGLHQYQTLGKLLEVPVVVARFHVRGGWYLGLTHVAQEDIEDLRRMPGLVVQLL